MKNTKKLRILFVLLLLLVIIYLVVSMYKFITLSHIQKEIDSFNVSSNYYVKLDVKDTMVVEYYHKDSVTKTLKNGNVVNWTDGKKLYSMVDGKLKESGSAPDTSMPLLILAKLNTENTMQRVLTSFSLSLGIHKQELNGKSYIKVQYHDEVIYLDGDTKLPYQYISPNQMLTYTLEKGSVTDAQIDVSSFLSE